MTEGEKALLAEMRSMRQSMERGFERVHERIDETKKDVDDKIEGAKKDVESVKEIAMANKSKIGIFVAGLTFCFTFLFKYIPEWGSNLFK